MAAAKYHKIRSGDTLSGLAVKYHTTVKAICKLNGITAKTTLRPGRTLRVK
ncbi:MAG: LysM peptidoglycan-binding domain-containing protein [Bacteroidales bacterium]|nr:LysM peptidoglycan-binding domain-containing protein [Bacteroidales bacterium]